MKRFKKGEFITQNTCPDSFAIFGGDVFAPENRDDGEDYSLICYYNPSHFNQDGSGKWVREEVFEYDLGTIEVCEYTINVRDMGFWRKCTEKEKEDALKVLAEKKQLAFDEDTNKLRKLGMNEKLFFGDKKENKRCQTVPMYNTNTTKVVNANKKITLDVDENWMQKEPITSMDGARKTFVSAQCEKLKYSFSSYYSPYYGGYYGGSGNAYQRRVYGHGNYYDEFCGGVGGLYDDYYDDY